MNELQIIKFLNNMGIEVVVISLIVYVLTIFTKRFNLNFPSKVIKLLPLIFSFVIYLVFYLIVYKDLNVEFISQKSITICGISYIYSSLFDKIESRMEEENVDIIELILKCYIKFGDTKTIKDTIKSQKDLDENGVKELIKSSEPSIDEESLNLITKLIVKTTTK